MQTSWLTYRAVAPLAMATLLPLMCFDTSSCRADDRVWWTSSHLVGSPEPPLEFTSAPYLDDVEWQQAIFAATEPGSGWLWVLESGGGDARIRMVKPSSTSAASTHTLIELDDTVVYSFEFHPRFTENGFVYLFTNQSHEETRKKWNRIIRYKVDPAALKALQDPTDPDDGDGTGGESSQQAIKESGQLIIEWRSQGHDGGGIVFGNDGLMYLTSGDGTSDSDAWLSAQDITNLLGGVLRIDVDHPEPDRSYSIPSDNPYRHHKHARGELYAIGLRNPWRMCVDRKSGRIWIGNNGQDLWETVHLLERGANFGWSVYEGSRPFYLNRERGPGPFVPATVEHHHREARSLTGGIVYHGMTHPELDGAYIYGDYGTGKIWAAQYQLNNQDQNVDGGPSSVVVTREIADTSLQIVGFAQTSDGELIVVDHGSGLHRLIPNPNRGRESRFPRRLSQTGLFRDTRRHEVETGVFPYRINAPSWHDGARVERFLAVPPEAPIAFRMNRAWEAPDGTAVMQTLYVDMEPERRVETRILIRQQGEWAGYSYVWNAEQSDATLADRDGQQIELGSDKRPWYVPSRAECLSCHSRAVGFLLGMSTPQLDCQLENGKNQIDRLATLGLVKSVANPDARARARSSRELVSPYDQTKPLDQRARSYLHANCSSCHVEAGGGNARMELEVGRNLDDMRLIDAFPQHETFGIANARLLAPNAPDRSVLLKRVAVRGRHQMPPVGSRRVDERAVRLLTQWVDSMASTRAFVRNWTVDLLLDDVQARASQVAQDATRDEPADEERPLAASIQSGRAIFQQAGCRQCHRLAGNGGGSGPALDNVAARLDAKQLLESILEPSRKVAPEFVVTMVATVDGEIFQGRIELETENHLVMQTSGALGKPVRIAKSSIEHREPLAVSFMPEGLLDNWNRGEILDLITYLVHTTKDRVSER